MRVNLKMEQLLRGEDRRKNLLSSQLRKVYGLSLAHDPEACISVSFFLFFLRCFEKFFLYIFRTST